MSTAAAPLPASVPPPDVPAKFTEEPVVWLHRWNDGLMSFRVRRDPAYAFTPGQFARIGLRKEDGEVIWRAYSIVSAPEEAFLEFFLVVVPTGAFSSRVARLAVGDVMLVEKHAQGFLTADRFKNGRDLWLLATGTGLAPYISMLRNHAVWQQFANIVVAVSVREHRDLGYIDELAALAARSAQDAQAQGQGQGQGQGRARLVFIKTLTREKTADTLPGRIPALIESGELEKAVGLQLSDEHSRFMLCGNPAMVESMRALLKGRGFRMNRRLEPGHIIVENYW